ncbi:MAG: hypothetical protein NTY19_34485, partial [Planctomycetota bacterium]|nr:hypothetical protein [Planctomycetota bacterium]
MSQVRVRSKVALVLVLGLIGSQTLADDAEPMRRKQQAQEKARVMARDLVSNILDLQIRQFRENGLDDLPIFKEIEGMRGNLDKLVDAQMQDIVQLLVKAQEGTPEERLARFNEARGKIREVVLRLMAERQKLLRRLQIARIAAQVRQLIALETRTMNGTASLPEKPTGVREPLVLSNIEDQRDVKSLFLALVDVLSDVSTWGGHIGAGAADGLRILKAAQTGVELDNVGQHLDASRFEEAVVSQKAVIKGLRLLLEKIEETQGLISNDREEALKLIRQLLEKQEKLREEARQPEQLTEKKAEQLSEQQAQLHKDVGKLTPMLEQYPAAQPLLEQAKAAAYEAAAQLLEEKQEQAVAEQTKVIGNLAEIAEQLKHAIQQERTDRSAAELAQQVKQLEKLKEKLEQAAAKQEKATEAAKEKPAEAQQQEQQVAKDLAAATKEATADNKDLPGVIESRLADAQEAVGKAAETMQEAAPQAAPAREQAAQSAEQAIQQALAETESQLADSKRQQMAVEVGELARAAEALERAAASEREISKDTAQAAAEQGLAAEEAKAMAQEQATVAEVAAKIAE